MGWFTSQFHDLDTTRIILISVMLFIVGMQRAGLRGISMPFIPFFVTEFGALPGSAYILMTYVIGDIAAVLYYRRAADVRTIARLMPWTLFGMGTGMVVGLQLSDHVFRLLIGSILSVCLFLLARAEVRRQTTVAHHPIIAPVTGLASGFTTLVGNVSGPIMDTYLLSMGLKKVQFLGTGSVFYFIINLLKLPIHGFVWKSLHAAMVLQTIVFAPILIMGFFTGLRVVSRIPERQFRWFVLSVTAITVIRMLVTA